MISKKPTDLDYEVLALMEWLRNNYETRTYPDGSWGWYSLDNNSYIDDSYLLKLFKDAKH